jgi:lipopolysaccharide transport system ATP-binding protein
VIKDKYGTVITTTGTRQLNMIGNQIDSNIKLFDFEVCLMLEAGEYSLYVNLSYETSPNRGLILDETGYLGPFSVNWDYENYTAPFLGKVGLPVSGMYKDIL